MASTTGDLFTVIGKLQHKDASAIEYEDNVAPIVLQRWMSGVSDELQILLLNDLVNPHVFSLSGHPKLIKQLMLASASGAHNRCKWIKCKQSRDNKLCLKAISLFYNVTIKDARQYVVWLSDIEILDIASFVGLQPDELKQLKKQLAV